MARGGRREGAGRKPDAQKAEAHRNISAICREYAPKVIKYLLKVVESESEKTQDRIKAGVVILERGFGAPQVYEPEDESKRSGKLEIVVTDKRAEVKADEQD